MRAALCLRTSSGKQRDACTVETQREAGRRLITAKGWALVGEYVDDGVSAKAGNLARRHGVRRLLDDANAHRFDVVVVYDASRLTRAENQIERALFTGTLQIAGILIAYSSTGEVIDAASEAGDFKTTLDNLFAAKDNRLRRQRTIDGRRRAAREGRNPGKPPYGYACTKGQWSAPGAELVLEVYRSGCKESAGAIAGKLNQRGLRSTRGRRWSASTITDMIRPRRPNGDPYVSGLWFGQPGEPAIPVPKIVPADLAARARAALAGRGHAPPRQRRHVNYLDEHAARCGLCGGWIRIAACRGRLRADGTRARFAYYACERRKRASELGEEPCVLPIRRVEVVDEGVWREVAAWAERREEGTARAMDGRVQVVADLADAQGRHAREVARLRVLATALGDGALTAEDYQAQATKVKNRRDQALRDIATWEAAAHAPETAPTVAERAVARLAIQQAALAADPDARRTLVRRLFPEWVMDAKGVRAIRTGGGLGETKAAPVRIAVAC